jgi:hypothetical protein
VGLSRREALSLPGEKTQRIPRGGDPRGSRGDGASGSGVTNMPRASILDWLPYVAAARLAEDVPDDWARLLEIVHA